MNDILRVLTVISVLLLPLTLVASIFGMNVGLPGGANPTGGPTAAFWVVLGIMVVIFGGLLALFRRRGWL